MPFGFAPCRVLFTVDWPFHQSVYKVTEATHRGHVNRLKATDDSLETTAVVSIVRPKRGSTKEASESSPAEPTFQAQRHGLEAS